ncbi:MAG: hypothetical protein FJ316_08970 [SAR202 cluster bacterium]|nr:hypothetical protein [SAR202 cluster bacterium]
MTTKEQIVKAIQELPDNATVEDAMERLYLLYKIDCGIAQADAGKKMSQAEALLWVRTLRERLQSRFGTFDVVELQDESRGSHP